MVCSSGLGHSGGTGAAPAGRLWEWAIRNLVIRRVECSVSFIEVQNPRTHLQIPRFRTAMDRCVLQLKTPPGDCDVPDGLRTRDPSGRI